MQEQPPPTPDTLAAQHQATLAELTRMGLDIARTLHAQVTAAPQTNVATNAPGEAQAAPATPTPDLPTLAAAFDRISRTVRRTVLLAQHIARPQPNPKPQPDPAHAEAGALTRARRHLLRAMENKITRNDEQVENPDALRRELLERIEGPDLADDLLHRPLSDIIDDLGRDMGLDRWPFAAPYPRRTPHDIARLQAQAHGTHGPDPGASPWTHSSPIRLAQPRGKPDAHGITPQDRDLHAHIMGQARKR